MSHHTHIPEIIKKEFSVIIPIKNRTSISVDYEPIPLRVLSRNTLILSELGRKDLKMTKDGKIVLDLLLNFLSSLSKIKQDDETFEVVLTDFESDDYDLRKLPKKFPNLQFKIITEKSSFSRGKGLNIGFKNSTKSNLFFCDADMLLTTHELFDKAYEELNDNKVFFPVCFGLTEPSHQFGYWRNSGYGMCMMKKETLTHSNYKWSEYNSLGKEDDDIADYFKNNGYMSRYQIKGYFHQWHPESQQFKNKYYRCNDLDKTKIFLNFPENHFSQFETNLILSKLGYVNDDHVYIVHQLEKFVNVVVSLDENKHHVVTKEEVDAYTLKHNKKLKHLIIENKTETLTNHPHTTHNILTK